MVQTHKIVGGIAITLLTAGSFGFSLKEATAAIPQTLTHAKTKTQAKTNSSDSSIPKKNIQASQTVLTVAQASDSAEHSVTGRLDKNSQTLGDGTYFNAHTFDGIADTAISLEMMSNDFDAALILIQPGGKVLASYDGGGEGNNVKFILRLPVTGKYHIYATSSNFGEGQYRLILRALTEAEQAELPSWDLVYYSDRATLPFDVPETTLQDGWTRAIPVLEEQIAILKAQLGRNHPVVAKQTLGLATLYFMQDRFAEAEPLLIEALDIYRALPAGYPAEMAIILSNLGGIAFSRGQFDKAETFYKQAINILRKDSGGRDDLIPLFQTELARIYQARSSEDVAVTSSSEENYQPDAESLLVQAVEAARENSEPLELPTKIDTLANFYHRQGRYDEAESLYKEALQMRRNLAFEGIQHPSTVTSLNNLALLYQTRGRYAEAESLYKEAIAIHDAYINFISRGPRAGFQSVAESMRIHHMLPTLFNLAGLYRATDDNPMAISTLQAGLDIEEQDLDTSLANLGEADRIAYVAKLADSLNYALSLNLNTAQNSSAAMQLALVTLLRRKGRVFEAGIRTQEIFRQHATSEELDWFNQLTQIQQEIASLISQPPTNLTATEYQTRLARLRSKANLLEASLAKRSADLALLDSQSVKLEAVQAQIPVDGVLLEYVRYQPFSPANPVSSQINTENFTAAGSNRFGSPRYAAYLLFPDGRIHAVDLGDAAEIDAAVQSFTRLLQNPATDLQRASIVPTLRENVVEGVAETIKTLVFDPIAPYLQETEHLLISPDGQLNRLPFEALQLETGGEYLVQRYQISYLNSGRDFLKFNTKQSSNHPAVILANPDYETADDTVRLAQAPTRSLGKNDRSTKLSKLQVKPLPGTAAEAEALTALLPNAILLDKDKATENALKTVQAPRILHIATHGFFLPNVEQPKVKTSGGLIASGGSLGSPALAGSPAENPLLRSGLALAGFNARRSGSEDGVLTALEASQLNLFGTQLVVLSACETGLGDIANGEGVYGLRRAFAIAGAETQLMSLWQVSDYGTQSLMARYYQKLMAGMGRSESLRNVQLEMIQSGGKYSHPYYWAAFILAGDWRPL